MRHLRRCFLWTASSSTRISKSPTFRIPAQPIPFPFPTPSRLLLLLSRSISPSFHPNRQLPNPNPNPNPNPLKTLPQEPQTIPLAPVGSTWSQDDLAASDDEDISGVRDPSYFQGDRSLNVGPDGCPLFTSAGSLSDLSRNDVPVYMNFRLEDLSEILGEGLVSGMKKEFKLTQRSALMVRQSFLDLRDNFRWVVDPPLRADGKGPKVRKQIVLDGPVSCGKSITLAMLVHWA